ncbi:hypothetical protein GJ744_006968 [Endocarpon pusillum]|uniref:Uncharacterized protein n=1 Tax=Endocarpon pusillum TaxID=364733 RepID=A0A8H7ALJ9_9EURO|nr:hypothetical protein GJ744_006968 [Endocarpon pusillum]
MVAAPLTIHRASSWTLDDADAVLSERRPAGTVSSRHYPGAYFPFNIFIVSKADSLLAL